MRKLTRQDATINAPTLIELQQQHIIVIVVTIIITGQLLASLVTVISRHDEQITVAFSCIVHSTSERAKYHNLYLSNSGSCSNVVI